jgi:asparagine synthase (glutamine-hydrolysing)
MSTTNAFMRMKKRGPDDTVYMSEATAAITRQNEDQVKLHLSRKEIAEYAQFKFILGFHRMSVNDLSLDGAQPFEDPIVHQLIKHPDLRQRPRRLLLCNGEIYNYKEIVEAEMFNTRDLQSSCDVEVILPMYIKYGLEDTLKRLNGDFSFVLTENLNTVDLKTVNIFVVRDVLGIKPMYMVKSLQDPNFYMFVSELKGLPDFAMDASAYKISEMPPGTYWSFQNSIIDKNPNDFIRYSDWNYYKSLSHCTINTAEPNVIASIYSNIKTNLTNAVISRYNLSDLPVGVLLSGGFDSSIILSIVVHYLVTQSHDFVKFPVYAFTMGNKDNPDVTAAQACVKYLEEKLSIDIHHHIISVNNINQIIGGVDDVIYSLETFNTNTVRGALPYSFLMKYIRDFTPARVLLTGEGLDELCGYRQFADLDDQQFQAKSVRMLKYLSKFDMMRADKLSSTYSLELRHPFLDKTFLEYMLSIHPKLKRPQTYKYSMRPIEKYIVRKTFDQEQVADKLLPDQILWRPLQDASDSFSGLKTSITDYFESRYTGSELSKFRADLQLKRVDSPLPSTKEEMHYRNTYDVLFNSTTHLIPKYWEELWV